MDAKRSKRMRRRLNALDDPAGLAQAAAVRLTQKSDLGGDPRADRGNGLYQQQQLGDVVEVGPCEDQRERDAHLR